MTTRILENPTKTATVLVVDDDRRVRELLEIALTAHGFGVITAADGDEAIRRALGQRPDLIVLDLRLPKRSGLEVCDALRGDSEDPMVPIILVSAAVETDARLQAFARGVDDYLSKPFSPKELIARIKRHLTRAAEARAARARAHDLEREIGRAHGEAERATERWRRENALRELATLAGRDFLRVLDREHVGARVLDTIRARAGSRAAVLLLPGPEERMLPALTRGADPARMAGLEIARGGELAAFLLALERPVSRAELERVAGLEAELQPLVRSRLTLLVPLRGAGALQGLLAMDERPDGALPGAAELEAIAGLTESAAAALENCERFRAQARALVDLGVECAATAAPQPPAEEAAMLVARAGRVSGLPLAMLEMAADAVRVLDRLPGDALGVLLARLATGDASGWIGRLARLVEHAADEAAPDTSHDPDARRAALLVRVGRHYAERRARGAGGSEALASAIERYREPLDPITRAALGQALPRP